ncbi:response regulator [Massilia sp. IC2-477]|uniref:response regulator n=1 Tax=unclassified Massilia TaxID=2609279 RepID=UPI001D12D607|nr:response regulator [Massilia sp. IC2-477]MCC2970718.1 response regulator [Massilia sp. IC2-476]
MFGLMSSRWCSAGHPGFPPGAGQPYGEDTEAQVGGIRKVLVVDDEADVADLAEMLLSAHGLDAMVAYSAAQALELLATHPDIDAVISDVMMPGMNGLELAERISRNYPKVKIILASGYMAPSMFNGQPLKQLFIAKPYRIDHLLKLLHT